MYIKGKISTFKRGWEESNLSSIPSWDRDTVCAPREYPRPTTPKKRPSNWTFLRYFSVSFCAWGFVRHSLRFCPQADRNNTVL